MSAKKSRPVPHTPFHTKIAQNEKLDSETKIIQKLPKPLPQIEDRVLEPAKTVKTPSPKTIASSLPSKSFKEFADTPFVEREFLIPYLVPNDEVTVVIAPQGLQVNLFMMLMAFCTAGGKNWSPFGQCAGVPVLMCIASGDVQQDMEVSKLLRARNKSLEVKERVEANLRIFHCELALEAQADLSSDEGRRVISESLPVGCKLVVFDDICRWFRAEKLDSKDWADLKFWFGELNSKGIAVLAFDRLAKNGQDASLLVRRKSNLIHLTRDAAAPTDLGGGFNIVRTKADFIDPIPPKIQFWYQVVNGELKFDWAFRDDAMSVKTAKEVEIEERRLQVQRYLAENKSQKEIAFFMKVNASTISRDVSKSKVADAVYSVGLLDASTSIAKEE